MKIKIQIEARGLKLRLKYSSSSPNEPRYAKPHQVTCNDGMAEAIYKRLLVLIQSLIVNSISNCL